MAHMRSLRDDLPSSRGYAAGASPFLLCARVVESSRPTKWMAFVLCAREGAFCFLARF